MNKQFSLCILLLIVQCLIDLTRELILLLRHGKSFWLTDFLYLNFLFWGANIIYSLIVRLDHSGEVCAGVFDASLNGIDFLPQRGMLLLVWDATILTFMCLIALVCLCQGIRVCCKRLKAKKHQELRRTAEGNPFLS